MRRALIPFVFCLLFQGQVLSAQRGSKPYWQQQVDYTILVGVDVSTSKYSGSQEIIYTNNSPDTLSSVYFHLFYNAFIPGSEMDQHSRNIADPDYRVLDKISLLKKADQGYLSVSNLMQDGVLVKNTVAGTILEVELNKTLEPGKKTVFKMTFSGQAPLMVRRAGKNSPEGVRLCMAQWFPKLAEYDYEGWHADPYIGREFYGVWGSFDVTINIDKDYTVAGTGYLESKTENLLNNKIKTWRFSAPQVHDFTWAADPDFIHDTRIMKNGTVLNFYYKKTLTQEHLENWKRLQPVTEDLMVFLNKKIGDYPYKQYSIIQGGDGGMEYGMCTLITGKRQFESLVGVTAHELAHSWFQFVLASNENKHEWMDEGFAEYYGTLAEATVMGLDVKSYYESAYNRYKTTALSGVEQPQTTHADRYKFNKAYSSSAYVKGYLFLHQLKGILGEKALDKTIKRYFEEWSFKHPNPNDFIRCAEKVSGSELDWYLTDWTKTTNTINYGVKNVKKQGDNKYSIKLERVGLMPVPLELSVYYKNGEQKKFYIPLQMMRKEKMLAKNVIKLSDWPWAKPYYEFVFSSVNDIKKVVVDPDNKVADIDRENNSFVY
ncbi:MAG: peptidase M1 [Cryomorphaceae bacterium]|nr:peptidase M1 [Cryomorphaceae bacterium]